MGEHESEDGVPLVRMATDAMATRFELVLDGPDEAALRAAGEDALEAIIEAERRLSAFAPGSLLSYVNREAAAGPVRIDADLLELLELCRRVTGQSGGAFDVTVGPLMRAWGFRGEAAAPTAGRRDAGGGVGMDAVVIDRAASTVAFDRPGVALDLGGVAKGHGLDLAAASLRESGVERALLHGGTSSVVAIGAPPERTGWGVAIGGGSGVRALLHDAVLSVSAGMARTTTLDGEQVGHVMDPRTGAPPASGRSVRLAAVAGPGSAAAADAWSTALCVLGRRPRGMPAALASLIEHVDRSSPSIDGDPSRIFTSTQRETEPT